MFQGGIRENDVELAVYKRKTATVLTDTMDPFAFRKNSHVEQRHPSNFGYIFPEFKHTAAIEDFFLAVHGEHIKKQTYPP